MSVEDIAAKVGRQPSTVWTHPYQKVAQLLAVLAEAKGEPIGREELSRLLWPHSPRFDRFTNLRQTMGRLRPIVGSKLVADRRTCSLDPSLRIAILHRELLSIEDSLPRQGLPDHTFSDLVEEASVNAPVLSIAMMRENPAQGMGVSPRQLKRRLRFRTKPKAPIVRTASVAGSGTMLARAVPTSWPLLKATRVSEVPRLLM